MNLKVEEILILIVAFIIGYFVSNMISGSSLGSGSIVKAVGGKHDASSTGGCIQEEFWDYPGRGGRHETLWRCPGSVFTFPLTVAGLADCKADCSK